MYRHGNTWFDPVSLRISVGEPLEAALSVIPPIPEPAVCAVQAVVTRKCNLKCSYCNVRLTSGSKSTMNRSVVEKVIRAANEAPPGRLLMVTGGEPLLVPEITLEILQRVAPPAVLFTNATLITRKTAEMIGKTGVSPIVSLDGMRESHDGYRCNSWDKVASGLDSLRDAGIEYGISTVVTLCNIKSIGEDMEAVYERFHPTGMGFNILHWTERDFYPLTGEEYADAMEQIFHIALRRGIFVDQIARRISAPVLGRYRHRDCSAMGGKIVFHPDGSISNCISSRTEEDWSKRIPAYMENCISCHAAGVCGGGCAWDGIHLGRGNGPDPRHCIWTKRVLNLFLEDVEKNFSEGPVTLSRLQERYMPLVSRGSAPLGSSVGHGPE